MPTVDISDLLIATSTPVVGGRGIVIGNKLIPMAQYRAPAPTSGLVMAAALSTDKQTAQTGQQFTKVGTPSFTVKNGIACVAVGGGNYITIPDTGLVVGAGARTLSFNVYMTTVATVYVYGRGAASSGEAMVAMIGSDGKVVATTYGNDLESAAGVIAADKWYNIIFTYNGTTITIYVNGIPVAQDAKTWNTAGSSTVGIGNFPADAYGTQIMRVVNVRQYNRVLDAAERAILADQITNNQAIVYPLNSSPVGATSDSDTTWQISADSVLEAGYQAYRAFDNVSSIDSRWHGAELTTGVDRWFIWQKKTGKNLVRQIVLKSYYSTPHRPLYMTLYGSQDGVNWTALYAKTEISWSGDTGNTLSTCSTAIIYLQENKTPYYYHKAVFNTNTAWIELTELVAYSTW